MYYSLFQVHYKSTPYLSVSTLTVDVEFSHNASLQTNMATMDYTLSMSLDCSPSISHVHAFTRTLYFALYTHSVLRIKQYQALFFTYITSWFDLFWFDVPPSRLFHNQVLVYFIFFFSATWHRREDEEGKHQLPK